jgi:hypothetical protein
LAEQEVRVARVDIDGRGNGTGWLVGPDLLITAFHVISGHVDQWRRVTVLFDYKVIPSLGGRILADGRKINLHEKPLVASRRHDAKDIELSADSTTAEFLDFAVLRLADRIGEQGVSTDGNSGPRRGWFQLPLTDHAFNREEMLFVLGHPMLQGDTQGGPLKFTIGSGAELTKQRCRVRYAVNTEVGNSGSPVMDQDFRPVALHHLGSEGKPNWDAADRWRKGFNQGIPLSLIVGAIRGSAGDGLCKELKI